jgi:hypothetical protein
MGGDMLYSAVDYIRMPAYTVLRTRSELPVPVVKK